MKIVSNHRHRRPSLLHCFDCTIDWKGKKNPTRMNRMKCTIKTEPDALDLTNHPQHLLSPSTENEDDHDDEEDEYFHSEDEQQHHQQIQPTTDLINTVNSLIFNANQSSRSIF